MTKPDRLAWKCEKNENGVDVAIINRQSLVNFMLYAEYLQQEHDRMKEGLKEVLDEYVANVNDSDNITETLHDLITKPEPYTNEALKKELESLNITI